MPTSSISLSSGLAICSHRTCICLIKGVSYIVNSVLHNLQTAREIDNLSGTLSRRKNRLNRKVKHTDYSQDGCEHSDANFVSIALVSTIDLQNCAVVDAIHYI